jgi:hypothetical protein
MQHENMQSTLSTGDRIFNGGITSLEGSKRIAKRLLELYDTKRQGYLGTQEV